MKLISKSGDKKIEVFYEKRRESYVKFKHVKKISHLW